MESTGNPCKARFSVEIVRALLAVLLKLLWGYGDKNEDDTTDTTYTKICFEPAIWPHTKIPYSEASRILQILSNDGWEKETFKYLPQAQIE